MREMGKVPPEQTMKDEKEMLEAKGMTYEEFTATEEWKEVARQGMRRFSDPGMSTKR